MRDRKSICKHTNEQRTTRWRTYTGNPKDQEHAFYPTNEKADLDVDMIVNFDNGKMKARIMLDNPDTLEIINGIQLRGAAFSILCSI